MDLLAPDTIRATGSLLDTTSLHCWRRCASYFAAVLPVRPPSEDWKRLCLQTPSHAPSPWLLYQAIWDEHDAWLEMHQHLYANPVSSMDPKRELIYLMLYVAAARGSYEWWARLRQHDPSSMDQSFHWHCERIALGYGRDAFLLDVLGVRHPAMHMATTHKPDKWDFWIWCPEPLELFILKDRKDKLAQWLSEMERSARYIERHVSACLTLGKPEYIHINPHQTIHWTLDDLVRDILQKSTTTVGLDWLLKYEIVSQMARHQYKYIILALQRPPHMAYMFLDWMACHGVIVDMGQDLTALGISDTLAKILLHLARAQRPAWFNLNVETALEDLCMPPLEHVMLPAERGLQFATIWQNKD